ncbi:MAG: alfa-L-rhamnosidase RamA [Clostridiales bacterium]|nr:alfa-L-rhamnosidase RamA [Clostridiales bacterium]
MKVTHLRLDYMIDPIGFDFEKPVLGWRTEGAPGKAQAAYHVQAALDEGFENIVYDAGKVESDESVCVYLDMPLAPRTRYFWRVKTWDDLGNESPWSESAFFETARYGEAWNAEWIGAGDDGFPQLRKGFSLDKKIRRARAYATAAGMYCLFINGKRVGNEALTPNINAYNLWVQYQTYDVTDMLEEGENAIGAWIGRGYYAGRVNWPGIPERRHLFGDQTGLFAELIIEFDDGTEMRIGTDETWKVSESPLLLSEIYDGEIFDARKVMDGWCEGGFDDSGWKNAVIISAPKGRVEARKSVPVVVNEKLPCREVIHTPAGETVLDFGQNIAGWVRFTTDAPAGTELTIEAGEVLDKHGNFYRENMRTALARQKYICRGGRETHAPLMSFMGFRYVRLTGFEDVRPEDFTAEVVHSRMARTGSFECSDERVNRLFLNAMWGQKGNFVDVPTDCPQRDERMGWTGDSQMFCATACMNMESDAFYRKYLYDLYQEQKKHGFVPVVIPFLIKGSGKWEFTTTAWGDAATIMPWDMYLFFGDKAILDIQYDSMRRWVDYMTEQDTLHVDRYYGFHLGDWLAQDTPDPFNLFGATPTDLIATAYYAYSARIVAKTAKILGKAEEQAKYEDLYRRVREAFRKEYMTPNGRVVSETQTALAVVLFMGLCEDEERAGIAEKLAARIRTDNNHLTTGFVGTPYLCPALSENGLNEYAYELLLSNGRPSWLYAVERGATTIWERWNSIDENGDFGPVSMNSFNHYAYGSVAEWMYRHCAGINPVEEAPGFKKIRISPMPNDRLDYAKAAIDTQYGMVESGWKLENGEIRVTVEIPFNTTAEIILPDADGAEVLENGKPVSGSSFTRGPGRWEYAYKPNGNSISKRIIPDIIPDF